MVDEDASSSPPGAAETVGDDAVVYALLWLTKRSEARIAEFLRANGVRSGAIQKRMHLTVYHARGSLPGVRLGRRPVAISADVAETRFMVMAPGGENPRDDHDPAAPVGRSGGSPGGTAASTRFRRCVARSTATRRQRSWHPQGKHRLDERLRRAQLPAARQDRRPPRRHALRSCRHGRGIPDVASHAPIRELRSPLPAGAASRVSCVAVFN